MKQTHLLFIVAVVALVSLSAPIGAQAYIIPEELQTTQYMNSIEIFTTSIEHQNEYHPIYGNWANDNLRQMANCMTNNGKLNQLIVKMEYEIARLR